MLFSATTSPCCRAVGWACVGVSECASPSQPLLQPLVRVVKPKVCLPGSLALLLAEKPMPKRGCESKISYWCRSVWTIASTSLVFSSLEFSLMEEGSSYFLKRCEFLASVMSNGKELQRLMTGQWPVKGCKDPPPLVCLKPLPAGFMQVSRLSYWKRRWKWIVLQFLICRVCYIVFPCFNHAHVLVSILFLTAASMELMNILDHPCCLYLDIFLL